MRERWLRSIATSLAIGAAVFPARAFAAACCGEGGSLGERLSRTESAAFKFGVAWSERVGGWGSTGEYGAIADGDHDRALQLRMGWAVRASSRLELRLDLPLLESRWVKQGSESETTVHPKDVEAGARVEVIPVDDTSLAPALFASVDVVLPTGRSPSSGTTTATGQGVAEGRFGVSLEKAWDDVWFADVGANVGFFSTVGGGDHEVARMPRFRVRALTGPLVRVGPRLIAAGVGVLYEAEGAAKITSAESPGTGRSRTRILVAGSAEATSRVSVQLLTEIDVPASGAGRTDVAAVLVGAGVRVALERSD